MCGPKAICGITKVIAVSFLVDVKPGTSARIRDSAFNEDLKLLSESSSVARREHASVARRSTVARLQ